MDPVLLVVLAFLAVLTLLVAYMALRGERLAGRLSQITEGQATQQTQLAESLQAQERALTGLLESRLTEVSKRLSEGLDLTTTRTVTTMTDIQKRLAVIDAAQKNINDLSTQMMGLQDILSNKQARGAFGQARMESLVELVLPPSVFEYQCKLSNGKLVDCLIKMPNPPGAIGIDAKFPLEAYKLLQAAQTDIERTEARRRFTSDVLKHVTDIRDKYIIPGETAEFALLFVPSDSINVELQCNFDHVVEQSYRSRVIITSPGTLWAVLTAIRAVLRNARILEEAHLIQKEVQLLLQDVGRLDGRVENLAKHFDQASRDIAEIRTSSEKIARRGERIEQIELEDNSAAPVVAPPPPALVARS